ncbi:hypothetical protein PaeCFBP13512_04410 [Paenibacillus sp. CFBP13512]|uniref:PCYCGC motif-containing (lipo)protein n=1 Tax=Paenibacillus sp. CFBP13512 TaxID=2184007 RepID=UPI0010C0F38F|nr:PCYCGC motif-containing (lipo)protein [Paenibacillus sp. CFBP13512]TKJ93631.1 hypothetical protein PaeCFBP13512_04410 [Paenibacillus sp. CFBP13512]
MRKRNIFLGFLIVSVVALSIFFLVKPVPILKASQLNSDIPEVVKAYHYAEKYPAIFKEASCYCGCMKEEHHKYLYDCFTSKHGENCGICIQEALFIGELKDKNKTNQQILTELKSKYE